MWLDPEPALPFRDLTNAVWRMFPQHPPYGGAHPDLIPHLTLAERRHSKPVAGHCTRSEDRAHETCR